MPVSCFKTSWRRSWSWYRFGAASPSPAGLLSALVGWVMRVAATGLELLDTEINIHTRRWEVCRRSLCSETFASWSGWSGASSTRCWHRNSPESTLTSIGLRMKLRTSRNGSARYTWEIKWQRAGRTEFKEFRMTQEKRGLMRQCRRLETLTRSTPTLELLLLEPLSPVLSGSGWVVGPSLFLVGGQYHPKPHWRQKQPNPSQWVPLVHNSYCSYYCTGDILHVLAFCLNRGLVQNMLPWVITVSSLFSFSVRRARNHPGSKESVVVDHHSFPEEFSACLESEPAILRQGIASSVNIISCQLTKTKYLHQANQDSSWDDDTTAGVSHTLNRSSVFSLN